MVYKIKLDSFEGPMDLLLHLIEKDKIDIYDIPIARITEQYMDFLYKSDYLNVDMATEFLVMAATLLEIKSKTLLPKEKEEKQLTMEDLIDPREELVAKLLEYKRFKTVAEVLKDKEMLEENIFYRKAEELIEVDSNESVLVGVTISDIYKAFKKVIESDNDEKIDNTKEIVRDEISVSQRILEISYILKINPVIKFIDLFKVHQSKNYKVTTFLAILELIKMKQITIEQQDTFADIMIYQRRDNDDR